MATDTLVRYFRPESQLFGPLADRPESPASGGGGGSLEGEGGSLELFRP